MGNVCSDCYLAAVFNKGRLISCFSPSQRVLVMLLLCFGSRVTCGLRKTNHGISGGMSRTKQDAGVCDTIMEPWEKYIVHETYLGVGR